jgi:hypothetical protein
MSIQGPITLFNPHDHKFGPKGKELLEKLKESQGNLSTATVNLVAASDAQHTAYWEHTHKGIETNNHRRNLDNLNGRGREDTYARARTAALNSPPSSAERERWPAFHQKQTDKISSAIDDAQEEQAYSLRQLKSARRLFKQEAEAYQQKGKRDPYERLKEVYNEIFHPKSKKASNESQGDKPE